MVWKFFIFWSIINSLGQDRKLVDFFTFLVHIIYFTFYVGETEKKISMLYLDGPLAFLLYTTQVGT